MGSARIAVVLSALLVPYFSFAQDESEPAPPEPAEETEARAEKEPEEREGIRLASMAVCVAVEDRVPIGEAEVFSSDVGHLYCFTAILGAEPPTMVFHRWYVGERMINEIKIDVGGTRWRCWSRKTILPRWKGECRVEVLTEEGDILGTREFRLE